MQLGLSQHSCEGKKRFNSIFMDEKVIGALREFSVGSQNEIKFRDN